MSVIVDQQPLAAEEMGLDTVGQVLAHVQRDDKLVVSLLIDGQKPDLSQMPRVRAAALAGKTLFIETVRPRQIALEVLDGVEQQLAGAESFKSEAADLLQQNHVARAMEKLSGCLAAWNSARETVDKVSQLLRVDLNRLSVDGMTLGTVMGDFAEQLRQIKQSLMQRDYVSLCDVLLYETASTTQRWHAVLGALRRVAAGAAC